MKAYGAVRGRVLVTGCAGFIGFHLSRRLIHDGWEVVGVDDINSYYSPTLKLGRINRLRQLDSDNLLSVIDSGVELLGVLDVPNVDFVIHLAGQPGVRRSQSHPAEYVQNNLVAFGNLLEIVRASNPIHFMFASSSSVYGERMAGAVSETGDTSSPVSFYAATKKANEVMAHAYASTFGIPTTGLRFFTVYGDWGRPDMAYFDMTKRMLAGEPVQVYNHGRQSRDFTFVEDVVEAVASLLPLPPGGRGLESPAVPFRCVNIGGGAPVPLMDFILKLQTLTGSSSELQFVGPRSGDVTDTHCDPSLLFSIIGRRPMTTIDEGLAQFVDWYRGWASDTATIEGTA